MIRATLRCKRECIAMPMKLTMTDQMCSVCGLERLLMRRRLGMALGKKNQSISVNTCMTCLNNKAYWRGKMYRMHGVSRIYRRTCVQRIFRARRVNRLWLKYIKQEYNE